LRRCAGSKTAQSSTQSSGTPTTPMERRSDTPTRCPSLLPEPSHARPACLARLHSSKIARFCAIPCAIPGSFVAQGRVRRYGRLRSACKGAVPWLVVRHLLRMHAAVDPAAVRLIGNQVRSGPVRSGPPELSAAVSRYGLVSQRHQCCCTLWRCGVRLSYARRRLCDAMGHGQCVRRTHTPRAAANQVSRTCETSTHSWQLDLATCAGLLLGGQAVLLVLP
jgi:hypothetical protein